jgi:hypothetical protein
MRLLDWIIGREPVATATGVAAVITAGLGVAAAFGAPITETQIAALGALAAALAGWAARPVVTPTRKLRTPPTDPLDTVEGDSRMSGSVPLAALIFFAVIIAILGGIAVSCDALFEDEDEVDDLGHGRVELVRHEYDCDPDWDGCGYQNDYYRGRRGGNDNRGGRNVSPGPFDRSPVEMRDVCISLDCSGRERRDEPAPEEMR